MTECQIFSLPVRPNSVNKYVIDHAWGQDGNGWILAKLSICVFIHKNAEIPRSVKVSKVHILKTMNLKVVQTIFYRSNLTRNNCCTFDEIFQ